MKNPYKDQFNAALVAHTPPNSDEIIVLDGELMRTTSHLLDAGIQPQRVTVVEMLEKTHRKQRAAANIGVELVQASLDDYLTTYRPTYFQTPPVALLSADFCGTIATCAPIVLAALRDGVLGDGSVLAVTFSKRCHTRGATFDAEFAQFVGCLWDEAEARGLRIELLEQFSYGGWIGRKRQSAMHSSFWRVKK